MPPTISFDTEETIIPKTVILGKNSGGFGGDFHGVDVVVDHALGFFSVIRSVAEDVAVASRLGGFLLSRLAPVKGPRKSVLFLLTMGVVIFAGWVLDVPNPTVVVSYGTFWD